MIEGRVSNVTNGRYLERARVTVEGTTLEAFTDDTGFFRISGVATGVATVQAFYTGCDRAVQAVMVGGGAVARLDLALAPVGGRFSQQLEGTAAAINQERFSPNTKFVVTADEFGAALENDLGEVLKYVPGVTVEYVLGEPRLASMGGVSYTFTPVTFAGFPVSSTSQGSVNRGVPLDTVTLGRVARVEVIATPMPETPGSSFTGTINLVPRSAFERSRPEFTFSAFLTMRDDQRDFEKSIGPRDARMRKVRPGVEFSYVAPLSPRLGITVAGTASESYSARDSMVNTWRGVSFGTTGTFGFADTTPDRPYLTGYTVRDGFILRKRSSIALGIDYRLAANDRVSFSISRDSYNTSYDIRSLGFTITRVAAGNFSPAFTHGAAGAGQLALDSTVRDRSTTAFMPTLTYRHDGPVWKAEAGASYSRSRDHLMSGGRGWFATSSAFRTGVTIAFDDVTQLRPGRIAVADGSTGAPIDPFNIGTYAVTSASYSSPYTTDENRTAYANLRRDFDLRWVSLGLKGGLEVQDQIRDNRDVSPAGTSLIYLGRDGRSSTTPVTGDDGAAQFSYAEIAGRPAPFGFPSLPAVSNTRLWNAYQANPGQFSLSQVSAYRAAVAASRFAEETISAAFLRSDLQFFRRRLRLSGGVRVERMDVRGEGPLSDPMLNYRRDAAGNYVLIAPPTDPLQIARLTYVERGAHAKRRGTEWFPRVNVAFDLRPDLVARASYYTSYGQGGFAQYNSGLTISDPYAFFPSIVGNNPTLKPLDARTVTAGLDYYFVRAGVFSVNASRQEFRHFFGTGTMVPSADFLSAYGLDPKAYDYYDVITQFDVSATMHMDSLTGSYRQALTFLPAWARGVQVFANGTTQHASEAISGFTYVPRLANAGVSLSRERFSVRLDVNYRAKEFMNSYTGGSIQAGTSLYAAARTTIDIGAEHQLWRQLRLFAKLRNVTDQGRDFEAYGPATPAVARLQQHERYGALWTLGVKGSF